MCAGGRPGSSGSLFRMAPFVLVASSVQLPCLAFLTTCVAASYLFLQHAYALEMLSGQLVEGASALDVGSGSGYLTACMAEMCGEGGRVVGIDHVKELVEGSKVAVAAARADFAALELLVVDGFDGYPAGAPYDAIHVGAAAPTVPEKLVGVGRSMRSTDRR